MAVNPRVRGKSHQNRQWQQPPRTNPTTILWAYTGARRAPSAGLAQLRTPGWMLGHESPPIGALLFPSAGAQGIFRYTRRHNIIGRIDNFVYGWIYQGSRVFIHLRDHSLYPLDLPILYRDPLCLKNGPKGGAVHLCTAPPLV